MDFSVIGTLHSYVHQKNLKFAADYKKKTGQTVVNSSGNLKLDLRAANNQSLVDKMIQAQQSSKDEYSKQRVSSIRKKLLNGKKISNEEMGYLRKNAPELYKKAKKAEEAREDLKAALRKAKTKQEARQAVTQALIKASAEASAEIKAASGGAGGAAAGIGAGSPDGGLGVYKDTQQIGGPSAEALFGIGANSSGDEPSMIQLNEQINATDVPNADPNVVAAQEGAALKQINNDVSIAREVDAEAAKAESANSSESINNKADGSNSSNPNNPLENDNDGDVISGIMEKFIMVIRAIEDEWRTFAKSDDYKELAEDMFEEADVELFTGKHKRVDYKRTGVREPNQQIIDIISTYRNAMMYNQTSTDK